MPFTCEENIGYHLRGLLDPSSSEREKNTSEKDGAKGWWVSHYWERSGDRRVSNSQWGRCTYVLSETQGLTDVWVWRCRLCRQSARPYVSCRVVCARPELCAVQRLTRPLLSAPIDDGSAGRSWPAPRAPWQTTRQAPRHGWRMWRKWRARRKKRRETSCMQDGTARQAESNEIWNVGNELCAGFRLVAWLDSVRNLVGLGCVFSRFFWSCCHKAILSIIVCLRELYFRVYPFHDSFPLVNHPLIIKDN